MRGTVPAIARQLPARERLAATNRLALAIGLPLRNRPALTNFLQQLYDPASPQYRHYLTADQFADRFGPTPQDYEAVIQFARTNGLTVTATQPNRLLLDVGGSVRDIERALHVTLRVYAHPREARTFYAPEVEPSLDLTVPVLAIAGLNNLVLPRPVDLRTGSQSYSRRANAIAHPPGNMGREGILSQSHRAAATSGRLTRRESADLAAAAPMAVMGSGPGGTFFGNDFRAAYLPGVALTGTGQIVGLLQCDGYYTNDIAQYETFAGLPAVPLENVLVDGASGYAGLNSDEVSLDIEMAVSMAPGLAKIIVYEAPDDTPAYTYDLLNRMAIDNQAKQISSSWIIDDSPIKDQIYQEFAAQGQTFFQASGDMGSYYPGIFHYEDDPYITLVGGTTLATTGPGGAWVSEAAWNWGYVPSLGFYAASGGGISTNYAIPTWQQGLSMAANHGSTTMRNIPDVALTADNIWVVYGSGGGKSVGGTSCAAPLWAGLAALMNQLAVAQGDSTIGFLNPALYALAGGPNYASDFHDITTGNNDNGVNPTNYPAVPGYDLCTGWGTPAGANLIYDLAAASGPLRVTPTAPAFLSMPAGGPPDGAFQTYLLTNIGSAPLNWALGNPSVWVAASSSTGTLTPGGPGATLTLRANPAATNLAPDSYSATVWFTNLNDGFVQNRQLNLFVVTPPMITAQPTNQALLAGMTATFSVGTASNVLLFLQWQHGGTNLVDTINLSGSTASTLTVRNISLADAGSYSVVVSNAAGVVVSSNAMLTIIHSAPVFTLQPASQTVLPGQPASFQVAVIGDPPFTYQWRHAGTNLADSANLSGATSNFLLLAHATPDDAGLYVAVVSNAIGSTSSTGAVLAVTSLTAPDVRLDTLYYFSGLDGAFPFAPLVLASDGDFYGTTLYGGPYGRGTVFKLTTNGVLTTLVDFDLNFTNGQWGSALLQGRDGYFYGATQIGGDWTDGNVFRMTSSGSLTNLCIFEAGIGDGIIGTMVQGQDGALYGTAAGGGAAGLFGDGTVFRVTTTGTLSLLHSFGGDSDGLSPYSGLVAGPDGNFYGTTEGGGNYNYGTIFRISPAGQLTTLYAFNGADGINAEGGLALGADGNFYGCTYAGGQYGQGTVFQVTPSGALTTLHSFAGGNDGASPASRLVQAPDGNFYGTTYWGGAYNLGTLFRVAPNGALETLVQFDGFQADGLPLANLTIGPDGNLYGPSSDGGTLVAGTIFRLTLTGAPRFTGQPENQFVFEGETVRLPVAVAGSQPFGFQWQAGGMNLADNGHFSGVGTFTLTISNVTEADAGLYSVVASNVLGMTTSAAAILEVIAAPPLLTSQPADQTRLEGAPASFSVLAGGSQPLVFQWRKDGTNLADGPNLSGAQRPLLTLARVTPTDAGVYSVTVTNGHGSVVSYGATLSVIPVAGPGTVVSSLSWFSGTNGAHPFGGLVQARDGNFYGTTEYAGAYYSVDFGPAYNHAGGTVFRMTPAGTITSIYDFFEADLANTNFFISDFPVGSLVLGSDGYLYGVAGNEFDTGDIYRISTSGGIQEMHTFSGPDGAVPLTGLVQSGDGSFYGTTGYGGRGANFRPSSGDGTAFRVTPEGDFSSLYWFNSSGTDGYRPAGKLVLGDDGSLYGTTEYGGTIGFGTVFRMSTNGVVTTLLSFSYFNGAYPAAGLARGSDGNFYGTTSGGGDYGYGTIFRLGTNGSLTTLLSFDSLNGATPSADLIVGSDGNFYGTTEFGGLGQVGSLFRITPDGAFNTLLWFNGWNGEHPAAALVQGSDGSFYGTTADGGAGYNGSTNSGLGTVFKLTAPMFYPNQFTAPFATISVPYAATIATNVLGQRDDTFVFGKVNGPAWLHVAPDGSLFGTPSTTDFGTNGFMVSLVVANTLSNSAVMFINVVNPVPASIAASPQNQTVAVGGNATFDVIGAGTLPLGYAWRRNGKPIAGATGTSYTLYDAQLADSGSLFSCLVTNMFGSAASASAELTVYPQLVPNDHCFGALVISNLPYSNTQSTTYATSDGDPAPSCVSGFGNGVWYAFTPPYTTTIVLDTSGSDFDTGLAVYSGSCTGLTEVACNDEAGGITSRLLLPAVWGTQYYILAGGHDGRIGNLVLHANFLPPPPPNYYCYSALVITNRFYTNTQSTLGAPSGGLIPSCVSSLDSGVWYQYTPPFDGTLVVDTIGSDFDTVLGLFTGSYCYSFAEVGCDDDSGGGLTSRIATDVGHGTNYYILAGGYNGQAGNLVLHLSLLSTGQPPAIVVQPQTQRVPAGSTVTFSVSVSGTGPLGYQWWQNGTNQPAGLATSYKFGGEDTATLTITNAQLTEIGTYSVVVSNFLGSVVSTNAALSLRPLLSWGRNDFEQADVAGGQSNILGMACGGYHNLGLGADGMVAAWGAGTTDTGSAPNFGQAIVPSGLSNVTAVAAGIYHSLALKADGTVTAWGAGAANTGVSPHFGQAAVPAGLANVIAVAGGRFHSLALKADGTVTAWGAGTSGSQADPDYGQALVPPGLSNVIAIAAGSFHSVALKLDGTVVVWGAGTNNTGATPFFGQAVVPVGLSNVVAIAAGGYHCLALKADGTVVGWGAGLIPGQSFGQAMVPAGLSNVGAIAAGLNYSLALHSDGTLTVWGQNTYGQTNLPAVLNNMIGIAAGYYHNLVWVNDGRPHFTLEPSSQAAMIGGDVRFIGLAVGAPPLSYQWQANRINLANTPRITGAQSNIVALSQLSLTDLGSYRLVVTNLYGSATSTVAALTVAGMPVFQAVARTPGTMHLTWSAIPGRTYQLQFTPVLTQATWSSLATITATNSSATGLDPGASTRQRYYRVLLLP